MNAEINNGELNVSLPDYLNISSASVVYDIGGCHNYRYKSKKCDSIW